MAAQRLLGGLGRRLARPARPEPTDAWFDAPDALRQIRRRASGEQDEATLTSWLRSGYAVVEQLIPHDLIDEMVADVDALFTADEPLDDVAIEGLDVRGEHRTSIPHQELVELPAAERMAARDRSRWRVHAFFQQSAAADAIRRHDEMLRIASMILGHACDAHYSINFHNGSLQGLHEDYAVFQLSVPTLICGAWIACEDVVEGSGPLLFYPGSHRRSPYAGFDDYPRTNLQTAGPETFHAYCGHVAAEAEPFEPETFLARKGDVLFWHGMLIHGGAPITLPTATRRSYVLHFIPDGVDVAGRYSGPTNW